MCISVCAMKSGKCVFYFYFEFDKSKEKKEIKTESPQVVEKTSSRDRKKTLSIENCTQSLRNFKSNHANTYIF